MRNKTLVIHSPAFDAAVHGGGDDPDWAAVLATHVYSDGYGVHSILERLARGEWPEAVLRDTRETEDGLVLSREGVEALLEMARTARMPGFLKKDQARLVEFLELALRAGHPVEAM